MSPPFNVFPFGTSPPALFWLWLFSLSICFSSFSSCLVQGHNGSIELQNTMPLVTCISFLSTPFALASEYGRSQCVTSFVSQPAHNFPWSLCLHSLLFTGPHLRLLHPHDGTGYVHTFILTLFHRKPRSV